MNLITTLLRWNDLIFSTCSLGILYIQKFAKFVKKCVVYFVGIFPDGALQDFYLSSGIYLSTSNLLTKKPVNQT